MSELRVELYGYPVGWLSGENWHSFDFRTDRSAFDHFDLGSTSKDQDIDQSPLST